MRRLAILALIVLAAPLGAIQGQTLTTSSAAEQLGQDLNSALKAQRAKSTPVKSAMAEDIEIMRRILVRELRAHQQADCMACHSVPMTLSSPNENHNVRLWTELANDQLDVDKPAAPDSRVPQNLVNGAASSYFPPAQALFSRVPVQNRNVHGGLGNVDIDGVYLVDYGVVYHVTMPAMGPVVAAKPKLAVFSVSAGDEWDRTRRELRGEGAEKPKETDKLKPVDVTDVLTRVLYENGRHFSKLAGHEKLTIIVRFGPSLNPHAQIGKSFLNVISEATDPSNNWSNFQARQTNSQQPASPFLATQLVQSAPANRAGGVSDFELLGDLQAKQGKMQEAIAAYERAVEAQADAARKIGLYRKLADAYLKSDGKSDAVAKAIDYLQRAQKNVAPTDGRVNTAPKDAEPQTAKLIVTASKGLLDSGKTVSLEDFRKNVHIERIASVAGETAPRKTVAPSNKTLQPVR